MTVKELIDKLEKIEDKNKPIGYSVIGQFRTLDNQFGIIEYADVVDLQREIII